MTHKIHSADPDYLDGFGEVTYPQDLNNCRKCHNGADPQTPQGDNWKNKPSREACGACHRNVNFDTGVGHIVQTNNAACATCHPAAKIEENHLTPNATPNNPYLPKGVPKIAYAISDVTAAGSGAPTITFKITADGSLLDVTKLPAKYSGSPSFLLAWAQPQDGVTEPAEYNNLGQTAAQPLSVSIANIVAGTAGSITCSGDSCTATLNAKFPAGATMRAVGLQGYYSIDVTGDGVSDYSLHTPSQVMPVLGDEVRRTVINNNKCANCHEWFEGHGGNRVLNMEICLLCHVPNLSSSGRGIASPSADIVAQLGPDPLTYPEATQNMKEMIHGIHASSIRTTDYEHVRDRSGGLYYNWSEVTFPNDIGNCLVCHDENTYDLPLAENVLMTTNRTTGVANGQDATTAAVRDARKTVPNATDWVITPATGACYSCHDSADTVAHMEALGGAIDKNRSDVLGYVENCVACHGPGSILPVGEVHTALNE
jgi:OmcA/MtrC family decaheme c-type cytochrome